VNSCGIFQKIDLNDNIKSKYWKLGMQCMANLFSKVKKLEGNNLVMTKQMINQK